MAKPKKQPKKMKDPKSTRLGPLEDRVAKAKRATGASRNELVKRCVSRALDEVVAEINRERAEASGNFGGID